MFKTTRMFGAAFETRALDYLQQRGMTLVARNVTYRRGEIDLIMRDAESVLVFIEVRARASMRFGGALASIDATKCARLRLAARYYLAKWHGELPVCRFDAVIFDGEQITWLTNILGADRD
ncbi:YraN family protein [Mycoavidus sp. SF9855]|uniref:YraN family protein n=1 Tax=Mycoavidus sp. SF9855 TaxID=2968475 RepID=UPI00211C1133|nr:YraN family protein [Mycoavidus sp. SF9855]UUM21538.1 YraN family protein [Mycoavidus sp. SF9855]